MIESQVLYFPTWRTSRKLHVYNLFVTSKPRKSFLFSRSFHALSTLFPHSFHALSTLFPGSFHALSTLFPRSFHALSRLFPRSFYALSKLFSPSFLVLSALFPLLKSNVFKSILNSHPAIWLRATAYYVASEEQNSTREKYLLISRKATVIWVSITADNKLKK